ncbi:MAG: DUF4258 domain-containing protein [Myxococcales bacterium]|nr:DUF4258 domain-containing protein [Myxococcales bacterium]
MRFLEVFRGGLRLRLTLTRHVRRRMRQRGISLADVKRAIETGQSYPAWLAVRFELSVSGRKTGPRLVVVVGTTLTIATAFWE